MCEVAVAAIKAAVPFGINLQELNVALVEADMQPLNDHEERISVIPMGAGVPKRLGWDLRRGRTPQRAVANVGFEELPSGVLLHQPANSAM